jgi:RHH-type transcriptional regulator, proline utilization regulon repressor / proline dehydrogenase / delta 1-pyrroline-5-carboxylate dehydrogenase
MATTTLGVKLDDPTRERLKAAATSIDRTPHWLIKQAIFNYLEKLEGGATLTELSGIPGAASDDADDVQTDHAHQCFLEFAESILPQSVLRAAITSAYRRPEPEVVPMLIEQARLPAPMSEATQPWRPRLPKNCAIRRAPVAVQASFKACCKNSPCRLRKAWP